MKGLLFACLLLGSSAALDEETRNEILNHRSSLYHTRPLSNGEQGGEHGLKGKKALKALKSLKSAEVSGYHVEWFQYIQLVDKTESFNLTQFGSWYEDDVNNATRVEVVTYYGENAYPGEYITIGDTEYGIYEDDKGDIVCEIGTPSPSSNADYEYVGYAFFTPFEEAYSIVWGPRLVQLYYVPETSNHDTKSFVGIDAFTSYPVIYTNYNDTFEQAFIWSRIHKEDVDATDFVVPSGISCTSVEENDEDLVAWHDRYVLDASRKFRISDINDIRRRR